MKKKFMRSLSAVTLAAAMSLGVFALSACKFDEDDEPLTDAALEGEVLADWSEGKAEAVFESDGWTNGSVFNTQWSANNVSYDNGTMKLTITENPAGSQETNNEYFGGEGRTYQWFGYGDYEVCMKPAKKQGTASAFFTCTGNYDTNPDTGEPNPWDEIDIEFLGSDTTKVQFNYYVNGVGGHEHMYDLGFDASEEFHTYGFRWTSEYIVWFVDNEPVYKVKASESSPMPSTAGRILMNYWCGTEEAEGWMGEYSNPGTEGAEYKWVKTSASAVWGEIPESVDVEEFQGDWNEIEAVTPEYEPSNNSGAASPLYTVTAGENGSATITYSSAGAYDNVKFDATEFGAEKNWLHMVLKNNGDQTANIRINVRSSSAAINSYGFGNGELLRTSLGEGTFADIAAGETVEIEIYFAGIVESVELMLDSLQANVIEKAGNITVSDVKFAKQGEIELPEESVNDGITVNGTNVKFTGGTYVINTDEESNSMNVKYENVSGNSYMNISGDVSAASAGKGNVSFKVVNNGAQSAKIRVDLLGNNVNAVTGVSVAGDSDCSFSQSDSACVTLAAGATETVTVTFAGSVQTMNIFIDSCTWNDETSHSGNITFSEMAFGGEATESGGNDPVVPPEGDSVNLTFTSTETYTVDKSGVAAGLVNVTYTAVQGASYANISAADAAALAVGNDTFTITLKNNGTEAATVRVDLIGAQAVSTGEGTQTDVCNLSHVSIGGSNGYTDTVYGGTSITVAAGEEVTLIITYDGDGAWGAVNRVQIYFDSSVYGDTATHGGNFTISNFKFTSSAAE